MKIRRLTESGLARFEGFIRRLNEAPRSDMPDLFNEAAGTSSATEIELKLPEQISSRIELGSILAEQLASHTKDILYDAGFWSGLAVHLFDQICVNRADGRKVGEVARYIFDPHRKAYRHLVWASWWAMSTYGQHGRYLLQPAIDGPYPLEFGGGEVMGQIAANQMTTSSGNVIRLGERLYADQATGRQRKGSSGKGAGSPRRLIQVLRQFELTYDFDSMPDSALQKLLPKEFHSRLS